MKKILFTLIVALITIGFVVAEDLSTEETVYDQVSRVYDIDGDGVVDGTDLSVEEFTFMHLRFREEVLRENVDFEEYGYRCGWRRRPGRPVFMDELPETPRYGP